MIPPERRKCVRGVGITLALAAIGMGIGVVSCQSKSRLVEVYNNGPVGGPGPSPAGYYLWVGKNELPTMGNGWRDVDPKTLTPEQRSRIRTRP